VGGLGEAVDSGAAGAARDVSALPRVNTVCGVLSGGDAARELCRVYFYWNSVRTTARYEQLHVAPHHLPLPPQHNECVCGQVIALQSNARRKRNTAARRSSLPMGHGLHVLCSRR
jgi:hypothetical protein